MATRTTSADLVREHFRRRREAILAAAAETVTEHTGLAGSHREAVIREFLERILPKRFGIGRGMVYGGGDQRSREADIVIWDAANYPRLEMMEHTFFFAESTKLVMEVKSRWDADTFADIRLKCEAVKNLLKVTPDLGLESDVCLLKGQVAALRRGDDRDYSELITPRHIATAAIVIRGGQDFDILDLTPEQENEIDDMWPDVLILLEAGKVVEKNYSTGRGVLVLRNIRDDCLLFFTDSLLTLLADRVTDVEGRFYFDSYIPTSIEHSISSIDFRLTRPPPGRRSFMFTPGEE